MIRNYRKKFLLITFVSIFLVVSIIVGYINFFNYNNTMVKHSNIVNSIIINNGNANNENSGFEQVLSKYTIIIDIIDGQIVIRRGDTDNLDIENIVSHITSSSKLEGVYENFVYGIKNEGNDTMIVLSNFERDNQLIANYFQNSLIISVLGIAIVYLILFFSSSYILKPFIKNEENQKEFITNASHELKTPITIIKANLDVIKIDNVENEWTISIEEQINRLELLTSNLIDLSKTYESNELIKTDFSLTDAIKEELLSYEIILQEKNITSNVSLNTNVTFNGNEKQIRDVIKLLFDNIIKYSTSNLNVYYKENELYFTNSTDLTDGNYDYIFDRFTRVSVSRNQEINGYGIGLSIVKKIINNHNCKINAYVINKEFIIKIKL